MFDRKKWEQTRPITCRGTGMGDALDEWHSKFQEPDKCKTYDDFVAAKERVNRLQKAIGVARKKLGDSDSKTVKKSLELLNVAEKEAEEYREEIVEEYSVRLNRFDEAIQEVDRMVAEKHDELRHELETSTKKLKTIESRRKEFDQGEYGDSPKETASELLRIVKESKAAAKEDFGKFRNRLVSHDVRSAGVLGFCKSLGIGGPDLESKRKAFDLHMSKLKALETTYDKLVATDRECVMGVKALVTLLNDVASQEDKHVEILGTVIKGVGKLYTAVTDLTGKKAAVHGPSDQRKQADYFDGLEVPALKNELTSMTSLIGTIRDYIPQVEALINRIKLLREKSLAGVPDSVVEQEAVQEKILELNQACEQADSHAKQRIGEWQEGISALEQYVERAQESLKEKTF